MATIINKTAPTPLIPLANPSGVSIPSSAMAAIESAMSNAHIGTNKVNSKKKGKKGKKQQKATNISLHNETVDVPAQNVEVVEAEIVEPVKEEVVLPEVKTSSVVIAHTAEKEATKAALPDDVMRGIISDIRGMKNVVLNAYKNGAVIPEGFAKAVREVADTIDAVEKVDAEKRSISIKKETYGTGYEEPKYDVSTLDFCPTITNDVFDGGKYVRCFIPLHDFAVEAGKYPKSIYDKKGRSILSIISDNMQYVSDNEITNTALGTAVTDIGTMMSRSGFLIYDTDSENEYIDISPWRMSYFMVELAIPKKYYYDRIAQNPEVIVCSANNIMKIHNRILSARMPSPDGNSISEILKINSVGMNELDDISDYKKIKTHALSFSDIESLIHDPSVLIGGMPNSNPYIIREIGRVYPRAIANDGNIIICGSKYFNPCISK